MRLSLISLALLPALALAQHSDTPSMEVERAALHKSPDWAIIQPHLPDPATATAAQLMLAADVLHARRFPEDALDFYIHALSKGADPALIDKKIGVIRLELRQNDEARRMFLNAVHLKKNDAESWNDLAAADYTLAQYKAAIFEYRRAIRLDRNSAVMHANLGMAYFADSQMENSRIEFAKAVRLDPQIMEHRDNGGVVAHIIQTSNYGEFCFEMATLYAREHKPELMRLWLGKSAEYGYDARGTMATLAAFQPYRKDVETLQMLDSIRELHKRSIATNAPSLGPSTNQYNQ